MYKSSGALYIISYQPIWPGRITCSYSHIVLYFIILYRIIHVRTRSRHTFLLLLLAFFFFHQILCGLWVVNATSEMYEDDNA